ncbi:MAG TPA: thioredoxin-disulfide reductase [Bacteroidaceae bacterium]|nr:thioredoxin-disulfide reductase [Bacteroidaceae bacterium]
MERVKCLIIGSGPAGYTAAIYASRATLNPVLYEGIQSGGQLTTTSIIENFPGYPDGVSGDDMMSDLRYQAQKFGTILRSGDIVNVDFSSSPYKITSDNGDQILSETVIIATGATAKYLGLEDEKKYSGRGVSACAKCDGFFYRGKTVAVVGGGDTACEEAIYLSSLTTKVYLVVRKPYLRASVIMKERIANNPKIEILFKHNVEGLSGDGKVQKMHLVKDLGENSESRYKIPIDGFFLAIGHKPNSDIFSSFLKTNNTGYIITEPGTPITSIPGVFAAGDVADPQYRQAITAAASGCKAAIEAEKYLNSL